MIPSIKKCYQWYDLTSPQQGVWFSQEVYNDIPINNIGGTVYIYGSIQVEILKRAINHTIEAYDVLRTEIKLVGDKPMQRIRPYEAQEIEYIDFDKFKDSETELEKWVESKNSEIINLYENRLYYFAILHINKNKYAYYIKYHHIIADGWSSELLISEIHNSYLDILQQGYVERTEQIPYYEFYERDKKYTESTRFHKDKEYWKNKLLPLKNGQFDRSDLLSTRGQRTSFHLSEELSIQMKEFVRKEKMSLNSLFIAAYRLYYYKINGDKKLAIGCPIYNRKGNREKATVGMFTNTIPFILDVDGSYTCQEFLTAAKKEMGEWLRHYQYPSQLMKADMDLDELYHVCVNYYNSSLKKDIAKIPVKNEEFYNGHQIYDLQIIIRDWADSNQIQLSFDYKLSRYDIHKITGMFQCIEQILYILMREKELQLDYLDILSEDYKSFIKKQINDTRAFYPKEKPLISVIQESMQKNREKVAIQCYGREFTFAQLDELSNNLANYLVAKGVQKGQYIGIIMKNSEQLVISILSVLKLSAVYVPLNFGIPKERLKYIMRNCNMSMVLVENLMDCPLEFSHVINVHEYDKSLYSLEKPPVYPENKSVYIIYTSGTSGNPKGVEISEQNLLNYLWWAKDTYQIENDVFALFTSISFDLTVTSVFLPLITGSKMVIYDTGQEKDYLLHKIVEDKKCNIIKATPSHLKLLLDYEWEESCVNKFIIGGEQLTMALSHQLCERFGKNIKIYNEYGPTEATVGCMIYQYQYSDIIQGAVSIGKPIYNSRIYISNENFEQVPLGEIGEMYIAGDGVAKGYVNNKELTDKNFLNNHFHEELIYKTGDLARILVDGNMEYLGRKDKQVKWNGYRIELSEIEENLRQITPVFNQCFVTMKNVNGNQAICAYYCWEKEVDCSLYKQQLMKKIPSYMIPTYFIPIPEIPLTSNGKADFNKLPLPESSELGENELVKDNLFSILISCLKKVLDVDVISDKDDFYALGGDSISAIALVSELKSKGIFIRVRDVLSNSSIKNMAMCLEVVSKHHSKENYCTDNKIRNLPIVQWFMKQKLKDKNRFCNIVTLRLNKKIDVSLIQEVLQQIVKEQEMLNTRFDSMNECFVRCDQDRKGTSFVNLFDMGLKSQLCEQDSAAIDETLISAINISTGVMVQGAVIQCGMNQYIKLCIHHLVIDAVSWRILLNRMFLLLNQKEKEENSTSIGSFRHYGNWCEHLYKMREDFYSEEVYWRKNSSLLMKQKLQQKAFVKNVETKVHKMELDLKQYVEQKKNRTNIITEEEIFLFAFVIAWKKTFQAKKVAVDMEGHGREEAEGSLDIENVVGWFTTRYPIKFSVDDKDDLSQTIRKLKQARRSVPRNGLGYGVLKYFCSMDFYEDIERVAFNYIGSVDLNHKNQNISCDDFYYTLKSAKENEIQNHIDIVVLKQSNTFNTKIVYNAKRYEEKDINKLIVAYEDEVNEIMDLINSKANFDIVPSDFKTISLSVEQLEHLFMDDTVKKDMNEWEDKTDEK